jgi:ABC-type multidrug transport system ATPase subunit
MVDFFNAGAGKSTLISILTGLYEATSGSATLAGFNIKTETASVYKSIGICPQVIRVSRSLIFFGMS